MTLSDDDLLPEQDPVQVCDRPAGPDPPAEPTWTCAMIEDALIRGFRLLPFAPIYSPRGNTMRTTYGPAPSQRFDIVAFTGTVLGDRSEERQALLVWARAKATKGDVGGSISTFCAEKDWDRSTFDRRRKRACQKVAAAKNEEVRQQRSSTVP